jgi:Pectate lyase superfamily protein
MADHIVRVVEDRVVVEVAGAEVLLPLAQAATAANADRAEAALAAIEAIAAGAPDAPSVLAKADRSENLADLSDLDEAVENLTYYGRSLAELLGDVVSVKDKRFAGGAKGDGIADDAPAIRAAILAAAQGTVYFPRGVYRIGSGLGNIPQETRLQGAGRRNTIILRGYNGGYLAALLDGAEINGICFDGNGTFGDFTEGRTGSLIDIPISHVNQSIHDARLINALGGTPLRFRCTGDADSQVGGSRMDIRNLEAWRSDSTPNSGNFAIVHEDPGIPAGGHPISIQHLETGAWEAIDLGACNDLYLASSTPGAVRWSVNTRGFHAGDCRFTAPPGETSYLVKGTNAFSSCWFSRPVVVDDGATGLFDASCEYNNGVTDNSGNNGSCLFFDKDFKPYTAGWKAGATTITQGATGLSQLRAKRSGSDMDFQGRLIVSGAGAAIPAGAITFSVPVAADANAPPCTRITGFVVLASGKEHPITGRIGGGQTTVTMTTAAGDRLTGATFSTTLPYTIEISGRYAV